MKSYLLMPLLLLLPILLAAQDATVKGVWNNSEVSKFKVLLVDGELVTDIVWSKSWNGDDAIKDVNNPDPTLRNRPLKGMNFVRGLEYNSKKKQWEGGEVYDAKRGKWFSCIIKVNKDKLSLTGYVGMPMMGKTIHWERVE